MVTIHCNAHTVSMATTFNFWCCKKFLQARGKKTFILLVRKNEHKLDAICRNSALLCCKISRSNVITESVELLEHFHPPQTKKQMWNRKTIKKKFFVLFTGWKKKKKNKKRKKTPNAAPRNNPPTNNTGQSSNQSQTSIYTKVCMDAKDTE